MCIVRKPHELTTDLRKLAQLIDEHVGTELTDQQYDSVGKLLTDVVNDLLGVVNLYDYTDPQGHTYPRVESPYWDGYVHSILLEEQASRTTGS